MQFIFIILFIVFSDFFIAKAQLVQQPLTDFEFFYPATKKWFKATVPGCIHTDLLNNKLIPDPFFGTNEDSLQWIENEEWIYKTTFKPDNEIFNSGHINLCFEGLDTYALIYLNDSLIATTNNMFVEWNFDVKKYLRKDLNTLKIHFLPPCKTIEAEVLNYKYKLPAGNDRGVIKTSVFTRKAPFMYGWDWGARFVTSGIWKPVYLKARNNFEIKNIWYKTNSIKDNQAKLTAVFEIETDNAQQAEIEITAGNEKYITKKESLKKGLNTLNIPFNVTDAKLWWCNGLGNAYLYPFTLSVTSNNQTVKITKKTGIRTIELVQKPETVGQSFYFKLNGIPVFAKGANYIPANHFVSGVNREKYKSLLSLAHNANMNMLRVWGGGIYENNDFYEICDSMGIMIWQDFMFACSLYPWNNDFLKNIENEFTHQIKRLRNYSCIALWCGNNEMDEAWHNWGWQKEYGYSKTDSAEVWNGYKKIFDELIPACLNKYDGTRAYHPSSPLYGWGRKKSYTHGDSHFWGVWWGMQPFSNYRIYTGRFASEYGFQALPDFSSLQKFCLPGELNINSETMKVHQKHSTGYKTILHNLIQHFPEPVTLSDWSYLSQLTQAYGIQIALETHRLNAPVCMGSLFWQFNDTWPVVSWSCIDYYEQPKALYYTAKEAFAPVTLFFVRENDKMKLYCVSDILKDRNIRIIHGLYNLHGKHIENELITREIKHNSKTLIGEWSIDKKDSLTTVCYAKVLSDENIPECFDYLANPKNLKLLPYKIDTKITKTFDGFEIELKSDVLVKNLYIQPVDGCTYSSNFFDMMPFMPKNIKITTRLNTLPELKFKALNDYVLN